MAGKVEGLGSGFFASSFSVFTTTSILESIAPYSEPSPIKDVFSREGESAGENLTELTWSSATDAPSVVEMTDREKKSPQKGKLSASGASLPQQSPAPFNTPPYPSGTPHPDGERFALVFVSLHPAD